MQGIFLLHSSIVPSLSHYPPGSIDVFQETGTNGGRVWKKFTEIGTKYCRIIFPQRRESGVRKCS
jgi:hypothetical protein